MAGGGGREAESSGWFIEPVGPLAEAEEVCAHIQI